MPDEIKQLLEKAESISVHMMQANDQLTGMAHSPHVATMRARISAALDSLEAHVKHVAANPPPAK